MQRFLSLIDPEVLLVQVRISRLPQGFELRHLDDKSADAAVLRQLAVEDLRTLAQTTSEGRFRPLKAAPTLQRGWCTIVPTEQMLARALDHLYPGAVADWFAAQGPDIPVTHYRDFTARQTGMYRLTQQLEEKEAIAVVRSVCHRDFCLKQRLWTVGSLDPDVAAEKSLVPCLEPCALLMEFARKARRWDQEEKWTMPVSASESKTLKEALRLALVHAPEAGLREADFDAPANPRRLRWMLERLEAD